MANKFDPKFGDQKNHVVIEIDYDEDGYVSFNCLGDTIGLHDMSDEAYDDLKKWIDTYIDYACNREDMYND